MIRSGRTGTNAQIFLQFFDTFMKDVKVITATTDNSSWLLYAHATQKQSFQKLTSKSL